MDIITQILAIVATVFGAGWGMQFLKYRTERRRRLAEVKSVELDVEAKADKMAENKLDKVYETIIKLQGIVDSERGRWVTVSIELSEAKLELQREREARKMAEFDRCTISGCAARKPPRIIVHDKKPIIDAK